MMRKISTLTPNPPNSDMSLTPHSSQRRGSLHFDFEMRTDFTAKGAKRPDGRPGGGAGGGGGIPMLHENVDLRDMFTSAYDNSANVSVVLILIGAAIGVGLGLLLEHNHLSHDAMAWIALPGQLFIAALTCLITPMVFCSVVSCIGELVLAGKVVSIGGRTALYFALASITSSSIGTFFGMLFSPLFQVAEVVAEVSLPAVMAFRCPNSLALTQLANGTLQCAEPLAAAAAGATQFYLNDTSSLFTLANATFEVLSVSDQVISILTTMVPDNIFSAFASGSNLGVIVFAFVFGIAVAKGYDARQGVENFPLLLVTHANVVLRMMINMVVRVMPVAVISLIAASIAENDDPVDILENVAFLIVALALALLVIVFGVMGSALFLTTRVSIFSYLRYILPAQVFIFGCSSSIATLPMTMRCVDSTGQVSRPLSRFVLSIGATSNLNGTAAYMALSCIFLAKVSGYGDELTAVNYVMLAIVGSISSLGVAPVPHSGLVMVITVWKTVFGHPLPPAFSILVGADWILNRMRAIVNITNDTIIARIIAHQVDETAFAQMDEYELDDHVLTPGSARPQ
ncbi:hypothetical protein PybrP1_006692 [[Pythium] brassicae (nom. inval.)]|nr:hypothetical protein PybrP1_006692 [[Pythium] brassicae (nom. inval.)]